ncbi:hypothetical protein RD792_000408 [Penstemon davidsonii]|uniref:Uncharacterized protein n=1 Tax=Penstemon davidsonii TaxID=160366 RepID=A0ABR0DLE3_9LAMI|nr:hypothetical protein RD792_000408 [Penstemon davidsonii]
MIKEAGVEIDPLGDLNTKTKRKLGQLVLEKYGVPLLCGFGARLEQVVMLFCALDNIRKTSLFPPDPQRLAP